MKTLKIMTVMFALLAVVFTSCEKNESLSTNEKLLESKLLLSIVPDSQTKATGSAHGVQADDNAVQTLEFFVFRAEGSDAGMLDAYKKFTAAQLSSLSNLEITTTTGKKNIYAVANSHRDNWTGIKTITEFQQQVASLQNENVKNFTMVGNIEAELQTTTSVTMSISRLVSRIQVASIKTNFAGTPYEGSTLQNVKIYLINVAGDKLYHNGVDQPTPTTLNIKKAVAADVNNCTMTNMLYDDVATNISDAAYSTVHSFYCYENMVGAETASQRFTKLVIQGELNGHTYYYPISVNREGFGYDSSIGHSGVKRNTSYALNVTILRPGSLDPDQPVEHSALKATINVSNWQTVPSVSVIF